MKYQALTILFFLFSILNISSQTIYYVSVQGNDSNDGKSWLTAKREVQSAIDIASTGDQVWVAEGTYYPTKHIPGLEEDPRGKSFIMKSGISVYGNFSGDERSLSERTDPIKDSTTKTILSGNIDNIDDIWATDIHSKQWIVSGNENNSYHVVWYNILNKDDYLTLIDGFEISGGNANHNLSDNHKCGGGIYSSDNLLIKNCILTKNSSLEDGGGVYFGYYNSYHSYINQLEKCIISKNSSMRDGGGVYISGEYTKPGGGYLYHNVIVNNSAGRNGGGVNNCHGLISNSLISNNSSVLGGGLYMREWSTSALAYISNCTVTNNESTEDGNPVHCNNTWVILANFIIWNYKQSLDPVFPPIHTSNAYGCDFSKEKYTDCISLNPLNSGDDPDQLYPEFIRPTSFIGITINELQEEELNNADWRLAKNSACRNKGNNSWISSPRNIDLDPQFKKLDLGNQPRIKESTVDIGAYEFQPVSIKLPITETFDKCIGGTISKSDFFYVKSPSLWKADIDPEYGDIAATCRPDHNKESDFFSCELSGYGNEGIELSYDLRFDSDDNSSISALDIEISTDKGQSWIPIFQHRYENEVPQKNYIHDISNVVVNKMFLIRFVIPQNNNNNSYICYLKNITIRAKDYTSLVPAINPSPLFHIYPNPATNIINIDCQDIIKCEIFNISGTKILESTENQILINKLPAGVYQIIINSKSGRFFSKFIKQ